MREHRFIEHLNRQIKQSREELEGLTALRDLCRKLPNKHLSTCLATLNTSVPAAAPSLMSKSKSMKATTSRTNVPTAASTSPGKHTRKFKRKPSND